MRAEVQAGDLAVRAEGDLRVQDDLLKFAHHHDDVVNAHPVAPGPGD